MFILSIPQKLGINVTVDTYSYVLKSELLNPYIDGPWDKTLGKGKLNRLPTTLMPFLIHRFVVKLPEKNNSLSHLDRNLPRKSNVKLY